MERAILWPVMNHEYEMVVVTSAENSESDRKNLTNQIKKIIETEKSEIVNVNDWGNRDLAYPIKKNTQGFYSVITFKGNSRIPQVLSSKFRLMDEILRYLIVRKEGEKKEKKRKKMVGEPLIKTK